MKNKWFVSLLMVVVMMCACWTGAVADEERKTFTSGDYKYALLDDGTIEITEYKGIAGRLAIPAKLDGKTVTSIGDSAFRYCDSLTSVIIPDSVAQIGLNPFEGCTALKTISVSPEHPYFSTIDGVLFCKTDKTLISYPEGKESATYNIPQGITTIGCRAFFACNLTAVTIPDSVTTIGKSAFDACLSLTSVIIPDSVTSIGDWAFYYCNSLTSIIIPDSVTSIGRSTFCFCESLTSVTIPDSVTSIGDSAFSWCSSLTSINLPDSVTFIDVEAFDNCPNLTLTVSRNSYALEYAKTNSIPYTYPDVNNDWLNN